ncbi:MAG: 3-oxoacyl-ACP synthase [Methyloglobulus sp.]|nr:3-oxoacyl-ACP synthase [Methyloglobulus sp.]
MFIESTGMVCSVGLTAESACAAMRAGIANFQELPYLDNQGEPIIGAMVPDLPPDMKRGERLGELLAMAITDCLKNNAIQSLENIPILVGLAEPDRPGGGAGLADEIFDLMYEKLGLRFHPQLSRTIATGHTSGFEGLRIARELFKNTEVSACLVCGVDSYINPDTLQWLDQNQRLKSQENSDGVIPGETSAAVLITKRHQLNNKLSLRVIGLGFGVEIATIFNDEPFLGLGLTKATREALDQGGVQFHQIDLRISDITGESYGFREQALVKGRLLRVRKDDFPIWHCADSVGDCGAGAGVVQLVLAYQALLKGYMPGELVMGFTSSHYGARSTVLISSK